MKVTTRPLPILLIICCMLAMELQASKPFVNNPNDFEILMQRIRQDSTKNPDIGDELKKYNEEDGSFTDIDYASQQRTNWPPIAHIERLNDFASAYIHHQNKFYKDQSLFDKIQKGLEFWQERNPDCNNWWYNQIAEPQKLGILLIKMRAGERKLSQELESNILKRIREDGGDPVKWTGANRTDIALHWIYRSCLTQNETDLNIAFDHIYSPLIYTTGEGFQHDNSYFQHGMQLYIGGYGDEILNGVTRIALYAKGTRYAIPEEKLAIVSKFLRKTYYSTIRGQYMLFDALGRGVSRPNVTNKAHTARFAERMIELDPSYADEYKAIISRLSGDKPANYALKAKHTHYFRGDYTLHVRPQYTFDVRMVSNRTARCEYGNEENLKIYFMSDGCTNIVVDGDEYAGIFPVWNWARIPGVTAPQLHEIPKAKNSWQVKGTSTFAGGVSDSIYGVSSYSYMDMYAGINTGAKKAWFFFDDEVVCLGAGIQSTSTEEVFTTVNQCLLLEEKVILSTDKNKDLSPAWVLHNQVGYFFPKGGKVFVENQLQTGSWYDINHSAPNKIEEKEVFTIGFNHGKNPSNADYAYIVVSGKQTAKEMKEYQSTNSIEILSNTEKVQVVRNKKLGICQMVFYEPGEFKNKDITVKVDRACALMIKDMNRHETSLHIADPGQTQSNIKVSIYMPGKYKIAKELDCDFRESGIYAGGTQAKIF